MAAALIRFLTDEKLCLEFAGRARAEGVRRFDARTNIRAIEKRILQACGF